MTPAEASAFVNRRVVVAVRDHYLMPGSVLYVRGILQPFRLRKEHEGALLVRVRLDDFTELSTTTDRLTDDATLRHGPTAGPEAES